jgi:hypothetical protein
MFGRTWWIGMAMLALTLSSGCKIIEDRQREREREREFEREQMMNRNRGNPCCPNPCYPQPGTYGQPSGFAPQGYGNCGCP